MGHCISVIVQDLTVALLQLFFPSNLSTLPVPQHIASTERSGSCVLFKLLHTKKSYILFFSKVCAYEALIQEIFEEHCHVMLNFVILMP